MELHGKNIGKIKKKIALQRMRKKERENSHYFTNFSSKCYCALRNVNEASTVTTGYQNPDHADQPIYQFKSRWTLKYKSTVAFENSYKIQPS